MTTCGTHQHMLASSPFQNPPAGEGVLGHGELEETLCGECQLGKGWFKYTSVLKAFGVLVTKWAGPTAKPRNKTRPISKVKSFQQCPSHLPHPSPALVPCVPFRKRARSCPPCLESPRHGPQMEKDVPEEARPQHPWHVGVFSAV